MYVKIRSAKIEELKTMGTARILSSIVTSKIFLIGVVLICLLFTNSFTKFKHLSSSLHKSSKVSAASLVEKDRLLKLGARNVADKNETEGKENLWDKLKPNRKSPEARESKARQEKKQYSTFPQSNFQRNHSQASTRIAKPSSTGNDRIRTSFPL